MERLEKLTALLWGQAVNHFPPNPRTSAFHLGHEGQRKEVALGGLAWQP